MHARYQSVGVYMYSILLFHKVQVPAIFRNLSSTWKSATREIRLVVLLESQEQLI